MGAQANRPKTSEGVRPKINRFLLFLDVQTLWNLLCKSIDIANIPVLKLHISFVIVCVIFAFNISYLKLHVNSTAPLQPSWRDIWPGWRKRGWLGWVTMTMAMTMTMTMKRHCLQVRMLSIITGSYLIFWGMDLHNMYFIVEEHAEAFCLYISVINVVNHVEKCFDTLISSKLNYS